MRWTIQVPRSLSYDRASPMAREETHKVLRDRHDGGAPPFSARRYLI